MRTEETESRMMVDLANRDRSRIHWERHRGLVIWCTEWPEEDGNGTWTGCYGVYLDGDWISDPDHDWLVNLIDEWFEEQD